MDWEAATCQLERAQLALQAGNYQYALALTEELLPKAEQIPEVWAVRAKAFCRLQRPLDALEAARRYAAARDSDPAAQWDLAQYAWRAGRLGLAQQAMEKALELTGQDPTLLAEYAWFLAFERGPRVAEEVARRAVERVPESAVAWAALGLAQLRRHRIKEAEKSLGRALKLDPNDPCAQCAMLFLLNEERQNEKAVALSKIVEDHPGSEPIVRSIRQEVTRRMIATKLVERGVAFGTPRSISLWWRVVMWMIAGLAAGWMLFIFQAKDIGTIALCIAVPFLCTWLIIRLFGD